MPIEEQEEQMDTEMERVMYMDWLNAQEVPPFDDCPVCECEDAAFAARKRAMSLVATDEPCGCEDCFCQCHSYWEDGPDV